MTEPDYDIICSDAPAVFSPIRDMYVERGEQADWEILHELHYKAAAAVFGPNYWRLVLDGETIGVLVMSMPRGLLRDRHLVFPKLKPGGDNKTTNTYRYKWVNANFRLVSRVVVDTMYRGLGLSYRFQNLVSRMDGHKYIEIQSSMSKYNLFAQRAGFRFVKPARARKYEIGLQFFRQHFSCNPADHEAVMEEYLNIPEYHREKVLHDFRAFYFQHSARERTGNNGHDAKERVFEMPMEVLVTNFQQMVLASPLYGIYQNPDYERELPDRIPLLAFDNQDPTDPLNLDLL